MLRASVLARRIHFKGHVTKGAALSNLSASSPALSPGQSLVEYVKAHAVDDDERHRSHTNPSRPRLVCALGGNALKQPHQEGTLAEMSSNALTAARQIAKVRHERGYDVCVTHGNGPQVGAIYLQNEMARAKVPPMPLHICGAQSQGQLGFILQSALEAEANQLLASSAPSSESPSRPVVVLVGTRVRVDPNDPAFANPTKPIGSFYTAEAAKTLAAEGKVVKEDAGRGWRVVVPSPMPVEIVEADAIRCLLDQGQTVVACGGGGVPVLWKPGSGAAGSAAALIGSDAVIDKDLASERLATLVKASILVILTDVDAVYLDFRDATKRKRLDAVTPAQLRQFAMEGHFPAGSMGPKVEAVCRFVENNQPHGVAYITSLERMNDALDGTAGTCIRAASGDGRVVSGDCEQRPCIPAVAVGSPLPAPSSLWSSAAEWLLPIKCLMHRPNDCGELSIPVIHPAAALFEQGFDPDDAAADHAKFVELLRSRGVQVLLLRDVLVSKAAEDPVWLDKLRNLAKACVSLDLRAVPQSAHADHRETVMNSIDKLSPRHVVDTIVNRPRIKPVETHINTGLQATYEVQPEMNLFFTRDQCITTARGPVLANMNSTQRAAEVRIVALALEAMGTPAVFAVHGDGRLEGGDFIPAGDWCFQGQGLRTNEEAVRQLLEADVYGCRYVCVVKDAWKHQEEMHLDTYFNVAGENVCTLVDTRVDATPGSRHWLQCDVYERGLGGTYRKIRINEPFLTVLRAAGFDRVVRVPKCDQLIYGCNYLTMGNRDIVLVKRNAGVSDLYKRDLKSAGVSFVEIDLTSLTKGYGAAHCTTQVCRRP